MHLFEHAQRLHYFNNHLNSCPCRGQRQVRGKKEALHAPGDWVCCQQSWPKWKSCFHFGILLFSYVWFIVTWCLSSHTPMYHRTHEGEKQKFVQKKFAQICPFFIQHTYKKGRKAWEMVCWYKIFFIYLSVDVPIILWTIATWTGKIALILFENSIEASD